LGLIFFQYFNKNNIINEGAEADSPSNVECTDAVHEPELTSQSPVLEVHEHKDLLEKQNVKNESDDKQEVQDTQECPSVDDVIEKPDHDGDKNILHNKSLDGNTLMTAPTSSGLGSSIPGGIRINILPTQQSKGSKVGLERQESTRSVSESDDADNEKGAEFDPEAIVQPSVPEQADLKPKLKGRVFAEMPVQKKGGELSSLCSIM
jgi:hypothetical protein